MTLLVEGFADVVFPVTVAPADTGRLALVAASDTGLLRITPGLDLLGSLAGLVAVVWPWIGFNALDKRDWK